MFYTFMIIACKGRTLQGGVNLTLIAARDGDAVIVSLGEELAADGSIKEPMRTGNTFVDTWTLRKGVNTVSQHEYIEFRYAMLSVCAPPPPAPPHPSPHPPPPAPPTPPTPPKQCISAPESVSVTFGCERGTIDDVVFASFGTPTGTCTAGANSPSNTFKVGGCNQQDTAAILKNLCVGKASCTVPEPMVHFFGEPCHHVTKTLDAAVSCTTLMPKHANDKYWMVHLDGADAKSVGGGGAAAGGVTCNQTLPQVVAADAWIVRCVSAASSPLCNW